MTTLMAFILGTLFGFLLTGIGLALWEDIKRERRVRSWYRNGGMR